MLPRIVSHSTEHEQAGLSTCKLQRAHKSNDTTGRERRFAGHVPRWLTDHMTRLGAVMSEAIVHHYGRDELLRRLANPFDSLLIGQGAGRDSSS